MAAEAAGESWLLADRPARVLARRWRWKGGEIDLVLEEPSIRGVELVFVEIRTRGEGGWVHPIETIGPGKRLKLARTAELFLSSYLRLGGRASSLRWDFLTGERDERGQIGWTRWVNALG